MKSQNEFEFDRRSFLNGGLATVSSGLLLEAFGPGALRAEGDKEKAKVPTIIGERELLKGLDGMSRSVAKGKNPFVDGHNAAAVIASSFFCQEQKIGEEAQRELLAFMEKRLLRSRIYQAQPKEDPDLELEKGLLADIEEGIGDLRRIGHNIIFAALGLKALRAMPQTRTPMRVEGLQAMIRSFNKIDRGVFVPDDPGLVGLEDEKKFVHFIFKEYLDALDLYLNGNGHHGFAGHTLTVGHALLEMHRMGHKEIARKGVQAFWQFVGQARKGADRGGKRVAKGPEKPPTALVEEFWEHYQQRGPRTLVSSHLIKYPKYPYSYYALLKELEDRELKARLLKNLFHLRAMT